MSKVKKVAEELLRKYPTMFSADFEANKKALDQVAVIRNRALRNQIAGAISAMASELVPEIQPKAETEEITTEQPNAESSQGAMAQEAQ